MLDRVVSAVTIQDRRVSTLAVSPCDCTIAVFSMLARAIASAATSPTIDKCMMTMIDCDIKLFELDVGKLSALHTKVLMMFRILSAQVDKISYG